MRTLILALLGVASMTGIATADPVAVNAFVTSIDRKDKQGCIDAFAPGARFIDVGADYSERIEWFCNTVIDTNGTYTVLSMSTDGDTTRWDLSFRADNYRLEGTSTLKGAEGKIIDLTIGPR